MDLPCHLEIFKKKLLKEKKKMDKTSKFGILKRQKKHMRDVENIPDDIFFSVFIFISMNKCLLRICLTCKRFKSIVYKRIIPYKERSLSRKDIHFAIKFKEMVHKQVYPYTVLPDERLEIAKLFNSHEIDLYCSCNDFTKCMYYKSDYCESRCEENICLNCTAYKGCDFCENYYCIKHIPRYQIKCNFCENVFCDETCGYSLYSEVYEQLKHIEEDCYFSCCNICYNENFGAQEE